MPRFSIIIVSWNALHHLQTFLPSVAASRYPDFEIILADNASTDDSRQWVSQHYPSVKTITFDRNYGYCGGNNRAAPYADGDILLFLNNDVRVDPDWLLHLAEYFDEHEQTAAVQPKIRSYREPNKFEYAGAAGGFIDCYGYPFCRGRIFDTIETDEGQFDESINIFWASGAAFAIRYEVFRQMGGFDETFTFHMEEIDLCWRLWNQGYGVAFCPDSVVYHVGGGSLPMHSPRKLYYNYRNSLIMLWKNYSTSSLFLKFPVRLMLDLAAVFRELSTGDFSACKAIIQAYVHFWRSLPKTAVKRSLLQRKRTNRENPSAMRPISIVWQYFIKGKKHFSDLLN